MSVHQIFLVRVSSFTFFSAANSAVTIATTLLLQNQYFRFWFNFFSVSNIFSNVNNNFKAHKKGSRGIILLNVPGSKMLKEFKKKYAYGIFDLFGIRVF